MQFTINRTKVELKQAPLKTRKTVGSLSIVPKWNWNVIIGICKILVKETINRTKVELKPCKPGSAGNGYGLSIVPKWNWNCCLWCALPQLRAINRTKVELKQSKYTVSSTSPSSINRTKVELKRVLYQPNCEALERYQSYQSGIETYNRYVAVAL